MGILFAFIFISIALTFLAGLIGGVIWLYRKFVKKDTVSSPLFPTTPLTFPTHFNWALVLVLLGFHIGLYSYVTYSGPEYRIPAAGLAVFTAFASSIWFFLLAKQRSLFLYLMIAMGALSGFWMFWRANGFVQSWDSIFFVLIQAILYIWLVKTELPKSIGSWLGTAFSLLPISFLQGLRVLTSLLKRDVNQKASFFGWLKTAIITLTVLAIFLSLLSQADPVFAEIVKDFRSQLVGRALWTIVILFLASLWWTVSLQPDAENTETKANWLTYRDVISVLGVVVIVVGVFLAVQFKYLFGGSRELLTTLDLTFSEYVRKGFTELLIAVFIGGVLAYIAGAKTRIWELKARTATQTLNMVMIFELGLLLISALQRDLLYVETYGLTRVRVVGGLFLLWLAFFLGVLLVYAWNKIRERVALAALGYGALVVLIGMNVLNVDMIVAKGAPGHHEYTDYFYLMHLSEDAAASWPATLSAIEVDTNTLLSKSELSPEDRAQLAGLKLGLLSFIENRDALYTKYASADWLMQNRNKIGLSLPNKSAYELDQYQWSQYQPIVDVLFPTQRITAEQPEQKEVMIPKSLQKYRGWQFANKSEQAAFTLIQSNEERSFAVPQKLLTDILRYQVRHQISLVTEESRLLNDLKYQFITVRLDRYWSTGLSPLEISELADLRPYVKDELLQVEQSSEIPLATLSRLTCASPEVTTGQPVTVYGVLRRQSVPASTVSNTSAQVKRYELREFATTTYTGGNGPALAITTPQNIKFIQPIDGSEPSGIDFDSNMRPIQYKPDAYSANDSYATFVQAKVKPVAVNTAAGCAVEFTSDQLKAYYSL
jgi:hypothetical protein